MKKIALFLLVALMAVTFVSAADARVIVRDKSVVKIAEDINMGEGLSFTDLVAIKGNINIKGSANGDVVAVLGNVHLYKTAKVAGDVVVVGGSVIKDAGAVVKGNITELGMGAVMASKGGRGMVNQMPDYTMAAAMAGTLFFKLLVFLGFVGLSVIIVSFMLKQVGSISSRIEKQMLNSFLWGVLGFLLIVPVAFLLMVTIIGIPLIAIELLFVSVASVLGKIAMSQVVGKKFAKAIKRPGQPMLVEVVWGLLLLFLVELIPFVGGLVTLVVVTTGFGAAILTKCGYND